MHLLAYQGPMILVFFYTSESPHIYITCGVPKGIWVYRPWLRYSSCLFCKGTG